MNMKKLKEAEQSFLVRYPLGFNSPEMLEIRKKHKMDKLSTFAQENLSPESLENVEQAADSIVKLVTRSSMVSVFEKPKFRDAVKAMNSEEKAAMVDAAYELLHGDEEKGFNELLDILTRFKLAKWTLISAFRCYYYPHTDFLFKPTTVKNVIKHFELEDLVYKPRPSYDFFVRYRDIINQMKSEVDPSIAIENAAFCGFLMMSMEQ